MYIVGAGRLKVLPGEKRLDNGQERVVRVKKETSPKKLVGVPHKFLIVLENGFVACGFFPRPPLTYLLEMNFFFGKVMMRSPFAIR